jgi:endonuclease YncB( thermonuclease family)
MMKILQKIQLTAFLILINFAVLTSAQTAKEYTLKAQVVGVVDGDTITIMDKSARQITVRLAGIDAPEKQQDFGDVAKSKLSELIYGKKVTIVVYKQDSEGRSIAKILIDGKDINLLMVELGLAWQYNEFEDEQSESDRQIYAKADKKARDGLYGLWKQSNAVKPSDFRRQEQEKAEAARQSTTQPQIQPRIILTLPQSDKINSTSSEGSSSSSGNGREKTVNVRGYTKRDGTVVAPHKRSKPNQ